MKTIVTYDEVVKMAEDLGYKGNCYKKLIKEFFDERENKLELRDLMHIGNLLETV